MNQENYLLTNGKIIDVETGGIFQGAIEIEGDLIKKIIPGKMPAARRENVIDIGGNYLLPGLIDMHCHIKESFAPHFVASGITTVRNTGGDLSLLQGMIEAKNDTPTPDIYSASRLIDGPPGLWGPTNEGNFVTDNPFEAREEVKKQVAAGAKFIKVYGLLPKDVMEAVVHEAGMLHLEVSCDLVHASTVNALDAAKMGVTWVEHASGFIQALYPSWSTQADKAEWEKIPWENPDMESIYALCEKMLEYNVKICPTLIIHDQIEKFPEHWHPQNAVTAALEGEGGLMEFWQSFSTHADAYKSQLGVQNKFIKAITKGYADLGGTVVAGTDTPGGFFTFPGMGLHRELELLVESGLTELQAIQAATNTAAGSINRDNIGSIKEGNRADLLVLTKNPLENIQHTQEIYEIFKGGKQYKQEEILREASQDWSRLFG